MYLTVIAWLYVVLMMSVVEAASPQGTVLGAISTFVLYGVLPLSIVVYIMGTGARKRARAAQQAAQDEPATASGDGLPSAQPDASGHPATSGALGAPTAPVGEKR